MSAFCVAGLLAAASCAVNCYCIAIVALRGIAGVIWVGSLVQEKSAAKLLNVTSKIHQKMLSLRFLHKLFCLRWWCELHCLIQSGTVLQRIGATTSLILQMSADCESGCTIFLAKTR